MMFEWLGNPIWSGIGVLVPIIGGGIGWLWKKHLNVGREQRQNENGLRTIEQNEVYNLAQRFVQIYKAHGIERTQIPRLLGDEFSLSLHDISTDEKLLTVLNEPILSKTCEIFGVRREWLDGKHVPIYPDLVFYKDLSSFIDFLAELKWQHDKVQLFLIKCPEDKLSKNDERWPIEVLVRAKIEHWGHFSEDPIWCYYPLSDEYNNWGYERTRLHLKAMVLIAWQFGIHTGGCQLPKKDIEAMVVGTVFPGPLFESLSHAAWHPDDYIFATGESAKVTDHEEALAVRKFLLDFGCMEKLISATGPLKIPFANNKLSSNQ